MHIADERVEKALDYLRASVDSAAKARAERIYLAEWLKSLRAQQMQLAPPGTVADREAWALSSDEYIAALQGFKAAVEIDESCRFKREAASALIEAWRSASANERASRI